MVESLALVLHHDEQAVLRAAELALEAGAASKQHVLNEPKADVHRYDRLRGDGHVI